MSKFYMSLRAKLPQRSEAISVVALTTGLLRRPRRASRNDTNNKGSALFLAVVMLAGMIASSLVMASIIVNGVKISKNQFDSTKAYFAAEAGAERLLWEARQSPNLFEPELPASGCIANSSYVNFDNNNNPPEAAVCDIKQVNTLSNGSSYYVFYKTKNEANKSLIFKSFGNFSDARRSVEITYFY